MNRVSPRALLRQLTGLAIAIATVVCAGVMGRGLLTSSELLDAAVVASTTDARWVAASQQSQQWRNGVERPDVEVDALEADQDDDDDRDDDDMRSSFAHDQTVALRHVAFPRRPARALPAEHPLDPSRFAIGSGLARGPPAFV